MPEAAAGAVRYALLMNGSRFACEVLQALLQAHQSPALLVLPEYAPVARNAAALLQHEPSSRLRQLAGDIEIDYAPRAQQERLAERLHRESFDYLLVACWPYLLDVKVAASVSRYALNLHPSMLPAYRGADPIGAQLQGSESRPGVSLHLLDARFDHGDILAQEALGGTTTPRDRIDFENRSAALGAKLFSTIIADRAEVFRPVPQAQLKSIHN